LQLAVNQHVKEFNFTNFNWFLTHESKIFSPVNICVAKIKINSGSSKFFGNDIGVDPESFLMPISLNKPISRKILKIRVYWPNW
jgi:hypothetical protein